MTWSSPARGREYFRNVVQPEVRRRHAAGLCMTLHCAGKPEINASTGKPKWRCQDCSALASKAQQAYKLRHPKKRYVRKNPVIRSDASRNRQKDASAKAMSERYRRLKAGGWCVGCGLVPRKKGEPLSCFDCRLKRSVQAAKRAARMQRPCIGVDCQNTCSKFSKRKLCRSCSAKMTSTMNRRQDFRKAS